MRQGKRRLVGVGIVLCWLLWAGAYVGLAHGAVSADTSRSDMSGIDMSGIDALAGPPIVTMPVLAADAPNARQAHVPDSLPALPAPAGVDEPPAWGYNLVGRFAASQVSFQQWTEGGTNTITGRTRLDGLAERTRGNWSHVHEVQVTLGLVKQDTLAVRKAADEVHLRSSLRYQGQGFFKALNPTLASELRTQVAPGYNHKRNPFDDDEREPPVRVSDFFSPATLTQSIGLTFEEGWFQSRLGVGTKETVVIDRPLRALYQLRPDQPMRMEVGIESRTHVDKDLLENVNYSTTLGLFAAFNRANVPDMLWENELLLKVNRWINVSFEFTALYDRDLSSVLQRKQGFAVGLSYDFI